MAPLDTTPDLGGGEAFTQSLKIREKSEDGVVLKQRQHTGKAALGVVKKAENAERRLSFVEAADRLKDVLDLNAELAKSLEQQTRWGLPQKMVEKRAIAAPEDYTQLFESITISEAAVQQILEKAEAGETFSVIFDPGNLTVSEAYQALIEESGVPCWGKENNRSELLDSAVMIDKAALDEAMKQHNRSSYIRKPLGDLSYDNQAAVLKQAATSASKPHTEQAKLQPKIIFVPSSKAQVPAVTYQDLSLLGRQNLLSPPADLLRFRARIEMQMQKKLGTEGTVDLLEPEEYIQLLKRVLADEKSSNPDGLNFITRFSNFILSSGDCLGWHYNPEQGRFEINSIPPNRGSNQCDSIKVIEG